MINFIKELVQEFIKLLVVAIPATAFITITLIITAHVVPNAWVAITITSIVSMPVLFFAMKKAHPPIHQHSQRNPMATKVIRQVPKTAAQCIKEIEDWDEDSWNTDYWGPK